MSARPDGRARAPSTPPGPRRRAHCLARGATRPVLTEREEHTCDLCGTYRPKQTMHGLYPQVGHLTLIIGICDGCRDHLVMAVVTRS